MKHLVKLSAFVVLALSGCFAITPPPGSLYARLGGESGVAHIIDAFAVNIAADSRINRFFFPVSTNPARLRQFKEHLAEQICIVAGGPCEYTGRPMTDAHAGLGITDQDFNALIEDLVHALESSHVSPSDQEALIGALGPLRKEIVAHHS